MKCHIYERKIMIGEDVIRISHEKIELKEEDDYTLKVFHSESNQFICKECATAYNKIIGDVDEYVKWKRYWNY